MDGSDAYLDEDSNDISLDDSALYQSVLEASAAWATVNKAAPKSANQYTYSRHPTKLWTPEKVEMLKEAVSIYGEDWVSISAYIAGRSQATYAAELPVQPLPLLPSIATTGPPRTSDLLISEESARSAEVPVQSTATNNIAAAASQSPRSLQSLIPAAPSLTDQSNGPQLTSIVGSIVPNAPYRVSPTPLECAQRWTSFLAQQQFPQWTHEQQHDLMALVSQQETRSSGGHLTTASSGNAEGVKINWSQIAMQLGRTPADVVREYKSLRATTLRHGLFTPEEDRIIIQRVIEWQQAHPDKSGLWVALAKELNRMDKRISERWRHVLQKRFNIVDGVVDLNNMYRDPVSVAQEVAMASSSSSSAHGRGSGSGSASGDNHSSGGTRAGTGGGSAMRLLADGAEQALQDLSRRAQRKRTIEELKAEHKVVYAGVHRWTPSMDERLREAVALYPRDWLRISLHVGVEANSSKCRKRWARVREKYRRTIEDEAASVSKSDSFQFDLDGKDGEEEFGDLGEGDGEVEGLDIDQEENGGNVDSGGSEPISS